MIMSALIDNKTIEAARSADIIAFFEHRYNFTFSYRGGAYRCRQHPSLAIKDNRLSWYWHSKGIGGFGVLDYLMKAENMSFRDAVEAVTGIMPTTIPSWQEAAPKILVLPEKAGISLKLYAYLCSKRGIGRDIVNALIQKEMLYEDRRGNIVFVGYDEHNKARFAGLRSTHVDFRGNCAGSDKCYGFSVVACVPSDRLYLYESAIDLMSHASLDNLIASDKTAWQRHSRLSLAGTSGVAIPFFLNKHNAIKELVFCLDNDPAGREAAVGMARKYTQMGYRTRLELPKSKDYNLDLLDYHAKNMTEKGAVTNGRS